MVAARRTLIAPKGGALKDRPFHSLAADAIRAVLLDAGLEAKDIEGLILGNALAAGGNPARIAALAAGLPHVMPALSVDTQCCSGIDAISIAVDRIRAGSADVLLAGGAESSSQAPRRAKRLQGPEGELLRDSARIQFYEEAEFTPWPEQEPSMLQAAQSLSEQLADRPAEFGWVVESHRRALVGSHPERIGGERDPFTRPLTEDACIRAATRFAHSPATIAPLADGAAVLLLVSESALVGHLRSREGERINIPTGPLISEVLETCQIGASPFGPGQAPAALKSWLDELTEKHLAPARIELMESFAAQVLTNIRDLELDESCVNINGGLLAMGHPVGASGAVLTARLHHGLVGNDWGVALIPAAGGIASGIALARIPSDALPGSLLQLIEHEGF